MKNILFSLFALLLFSCSSEEPIIEQELPAPVENFDIDIVGTWLVESSDCAATWTWDEMTYSTDSFYITEIAIVNDSIELEYVLSSPYSIEDSILNINDTKIKILELTPTTLLINQLIVDCESRYQKQ